MLTLREKETGEEVQVVIRATQADHRPLTEKPQPFQWLSTDHLHNIVAYFCRIEERCNATLRGEREMVVFVSADRKIMRDRDEIAADLLEGRARRLARKVLPAMGALAYLGSLRDDEIARVARLLQGLPIEADLSRPALIRNLRHC